MEYADFYDIVTYLNTNANHAYSEKELACNAYNYLCDYEASKDAPTVESTIQSIINSLLEDWSVETQNVNADQAEILQLESWLWEMFTELNLVDMDWRDYPESELYTEFIQSHF